MKKTKIAKRMMTAVGYVKAPKATFMLKHPLRGVGALLAYRAARKAAPRRRTVAAATATAVAVPMLWKTFRGSSD